MPQHNAGDINSGAHAQTFNGSGSGTPGTTPYSSVQPHELEVARTPVHVGDRMVSFFSSHHGAGPCRCIPQCPPQQGKRPYHSYPLQTFTLRQADDYARTNGEAALLTDLVRALEPLTPAYNDAKRHLCAYTPGGVVEPFRAKRHMIVNGLAYIELDDAHDVATAQAALEADLSIARVALSPGGKGFHLVVPVVPEPTTLASAQWALEGVHGHMVSRYGALFRKIDRLTSGIEMHYLASNPSATFRDKAFPLLIGAPPASFTGARRDVVVGLRDGIMPSGLPPFQDTTDSTDLAQRDIIRKRIRAALEYLTLPDGSRNDTWIPLCFDLIGAEWEVRGLYEVSIGARDLFVEWTARAAYAGSTKPTVAGDTFDRLCHDFDPDRHEMGSLESLYNRARAAGWEGKIPDCGSQESADSAASHEGEEQALTKRGRGRPKGSRNRGGSARQQKEERQDSETQAVSDYIFGLKSANSDIHWLGEYYTLREGTWAQQSKEYYEKEIKERIGEVRGTQTPLIGRYMSDCLSTLRRELLPAVVDTGLLAVEDRLKHFHLDTGEIIHGTAFRNTCVRMDDSGETSHRVRGKRDFYTTSRPYALPLEDPGRPETFDAWMEAMVPDEDTRKAVWEVLGMSTLAQGYVEQRLVFLCAGARSGKGTLQKLAAMLSGGYCSFSGGPSRLGAGHFANSALVGKALCVLPDSPEMPEHPKSITYAQYVLGLSTIKSLSGEDPITIEFKNDRRILALIWPGTIWWDSNFGIAQVIPAKEDAHSWRSRIIPIPMTVEIDEVEQIQGFHNRFIAEVPSIAYHAIRAYSERRSRGNFTFSPEMQKELLKLGASEFKDLKEITAQFSPKPGAWTSRGQIRRLAGRILGRTAENKELTHLYRAAAAAGGRPKKNMGVQGFRGLYIVGEGDLEDSV